MSRQPGTFLLLGIFTARRVVFRETIVRSSIRRFVKIDAYMPFYGDKFFAACEGLDDVLVLAYFRALWFYWAHTHADGIPNDDDFMRRLCRVQIADWQRCKGKIFGHFFSLEHGKWHQERARTEYAEMSKSYQGKVDRILKAREKLGSDISGSNQPLKSNQHISGSGSGSGSSGEEYKNMVSKELDASASEVVAEMHKLMGVTVATTTDQKMPIYHLLNEGVSKDDLLTVVRDKWKQWKDDLKMRQFFTVSTLFKSDKFPDYLAHAKRKPAAAAKIDKSGYAWQIPRLKNMIAVLTEERDHTHDDAEVAKLNQEIRQAQAELRQVQA